jgi:hypothetical protein
MAGRAVLLVRCGDETSLPVGAPRHHASRPPTFVLQQPRFGDRFGDPGRQPARIGGRFCRGEIGAGHMTGAPLLIGEGGGRSRGPPSPLGRPAAVRLAGRGETAWDGVRCGRPVVLGCMPSEPALEPRGRAARELAGLIGCGAAAGRGRMVRGAARLAGWGAGRPARRSAGRRVRRPGRAARRLRSRQGHRRRRSTTGTAGRAPVRGPPGSTARRPGPSPGPGVGPGRRSPVRRRSAAPRPATPGRSRSWPLSLLTLCAGPPERVVGRGGHSAQPVGWTREQPGRCPGSHRA